MGSIVTENFRNLKQDYSYIYAFKKDKTFLKIERNLIELIQKEITFHKKII